jgi:hypothetical protein
MTWREYQIVICTNGSDGAGHNVDLSLRNCAVQPVLAWLIGQEILVGQIGVVVTVQNEPW